MGTNLRYTTCHAHPIEDKNGELVDCVHFCSDHCHAMWCDRNDVEYSGWNGGHEVEYEVGYPPVCEGCGEAIPREDA